MSKYLSKYISTLPKSNRDKISALLTDTVDNERIISVGEYNAWYRHIMDTINKFFAPTVKYVSADDKQRISSAILNYLFEYIIHDLQASFTEANALFDFVNLNKNRDTRLFKQFKGQVSKLLSHYNNLFAMREHGVEYTKGLFVHFDAGGSLFLPRGYMLKDDLYVDYDGTTLQPMETVADADATRTTGKLILGGTPTTITLTAPEVMWEPPTTVPDFTLKTGTDINNSIDGDEYTHWIEILCFNSPVIHNETPTISNIKSANQAGSFNGTALLRGRNMLGKHREFYIKFLNKGVVGTASYVCSDDGVNYTDLVCTNDNGNECKYAYDDLYTQGCKNSKCLRYTQIGYTQTIDNDYTPIYTSHNEDTGLEIMFEGSSGYFYPGDIWKVTCTCEDTYGAVMKYTVESKCNTLSNWLELQPILDYPFIIDSIQYYDDLRHYDPGGDVAPLMLTSSPIYVDAPIRLEFEPRVITRLIITMRQENYVAEQYLINSQILEDNILIKKMMDADNDIDTQTIRDLVYKSFKDTNLRDLLLAKMPDKILERDTFCYIFGLADLSLGYTEYSVDGRSILKGVKANNLGMVRLNTTEGNYDNITTNLVYNNPENDPYRFGTVDPWLSSAEYDLFIKNYNSSGGWVNSIEVPILPYRRSASSPTSVRSSIMDAHLRVDEDGMGKLRFYSKNITQVYSVYNGEVLEEDTDYTIVQQTDIKPYETYINLADYIANKEYSPESLFVVSYIPETGVYLDKSAKVYLDDDWTLQLSMDKIFPKVTTSEVYLIITGRRSTPNKGITPRIHRVHLMLGEVDPYKFYPEGDTNEEFRKVLLTDSTAVR